MFLRMSAIITHPPPLPKNLLSPQSKRSSCWHRACPEICTTLEVSKWKVFQSHRSLLFAFVVVIWSSWENRPQSYTTPLLQLWTLGDLQEDFSVRKCPVCSSLVSDIIQNNSSSEWFKHSVWKWINIGNFIALLGSVWQEWSFEGQVLSDVGLRFFPVVEI